MKLLPLLVTVAVSKRIVINTWPFVEANEAAWKVLARGSLRVVRRRVKIRAWTVKMLFQVAVPWTRLQLVQVNVKLCSAMVRSVGEIIQVYVQLSFLPSHKATIL